MNRIDLIASLTKGSYCVCDIGCDHAYALKSAILNYGVEKGIAADIALCPLSSAEKTLTDAKIIDKCELVLSNGFDNITSMFDTAIIAGMGGRLISEILNNGINKIQGKKLILEPNCDSYLVRQFLNKNNFTIIDEYSIIEKSKYYEIIVAEYGKQILSDFEIKYGPILLKKKSPEFISFYLIQLNKMNKIVKNITLNNKRVEIMSLINDYKKVIDVNVHYILNTINFYKTYFIDDNVRDIVIISAGGGYKYTSPRESEPVAKFYNSNGFHAAVVNYRETLDKFPLPSTYLAYAIDELRKDKRVGKVILIGFSAGGHNALEVSIHSNDYKYNCKPDLLMLAYPVVTSDSRYYHEGSFKELLQDDFNNEEMMKRVSHELHITKDSPDLFLWGTYSDESVPVMNSLLLIDAYLKNGCNLEYHTFYKGGHGLSLGNEESACGDVNKVFPYISPWANLSVEWIKNKNNELK